MHSTIGGIIILILSAFIASVAQVLLKIAAKREHTDKLSEYLNVPVILAYGLLFATTVLNVIALKLVALSLSLAIEALSQVFVGLLSFIILHEYIGKNKIMGMVLIVSGILFFYYNL